MQTAAPRILVAALIAMAGAGVALATVWLPEFRHYATGDTEVSGQTLRSALARGVTPQMRELESLDFTPLAGRSPEALVVGALAARAGRLATFDGQAMPIDGSFSPLDYGSTSSAIQLQIASLAVPFLYLKAAPLSGDDTFFDGAREYLKRWWAFERTSRLPRGLQWNDHAVAARVYVLIQYWMAAAARGRLSYEDAQFILEAIAKSVALLEKPEYFTYRTNHGVMQNLALLHVAVAFPDLPQAQRAGEIGRSRFIDQLDSYVGSEGVVLEHSAGYHLFGVELLSAAARYAALLDIELTPDYMERLQAAQRFLIALRRPDGSLPAIGDTRSPMPLPLITSTAPGGGAGPLQRMSTSIQLPGVWHAPGSGVSVWWSCPRSADCAVSDQTVVLWSDIATRAHKHADDMSVLLWSEGIDWLTASGYWPYDSALRGAAAGWCGSNAPHLAGEGQPRSMPEQLGFADLASRELRAIDLERRTESGARLRRQVIQHARTWVIIDSADGAAAEISACWTFDPRVALASQASPDEWQAMVGGKSLAVAFAGQRLIEHYHGSESPFAGWTAARSAPQPAHTLISRSPPTAAAAILLTRDATPAAGMQPRLRWHSPEDWELNWTDAAGRHSIARKDRKITAAARVVNRALTVELARDAVPDVALRADQNFNRLLAMYPHFNDGYLPYRTRVSRAIGTLLILQLAAIAVLARWARSRGARPAIACSVILSIFWVALSLYLPLVYFR